MSLGKKIIIGVIVAIALLIAVVAGGIFVVAPAMAEKLVRERLDRAEQKLNVDIQTGSIDTLGLSGVEITDLSVIDPETGRTLATVGRAGGRLSLIRLLGGDKVISSVWTEDVDVTITREEDGRFDLVEVVKRARAEKADPEQAVVEESESSDGGILRLFGGTLPELEVNDVTVTFAATEGAPKFPVQSMSVPTGEIEHSGDTIEARTTVTVVASESGEWSIPSQVDVALVLSEALAPQTMTVKFDRPVEVGGVGPYPFLRGGFAGVEISPDKRITITDAALGFSTTEGSFLDTKRVAVQLSKWVLSPADLSIVEVVVDSPRLTLEYDEQGASALTDLDHAIRSPRARDVVKRARAFAAKIEERRREKETEPDVEEQEEEVEQPSDDTKKADAGRIAKFIERLPQRLVVNDATVNVIDHRDIPVARPARTLRLEGGNVDLVHRPIQGDFRVQGEFAALADDQPRGKVKGLIAFGYRSKKLDADVSVDSLDLSWLGQIMGPSVAQHIRGGTLRAKVGVKPEQGRAVTIDGNVSVENLVFYHELIAEEPITEMTASYGFSAVYDPDGKVPEAELLKKGMFKESNEPPPDDDVWKGSLVFKKGNGEFGKAKGTVIPAIYGTGALPRRMPARIDLEVDLPQTHVQDLFDSVPVAIQGPLHGTEMDGTFAWRLSAEIPPYRAADMQWVSTPVLEDFELLSMPKEVDPRKLMTGFNLTITDTIENKKGEEEEWERTVRIPPAKPVSARYITENGGLDIEVLDERRREREWPPAPNPARSFLPRVTIMSPRYWTTAHAEDQVAPKPWGANETIRRSKDQPYGPYVFVPLHHISKWVVKTVTTTEDGGFFRHGGFLFDAIKDSVEDNIEASRFRRGASTISMQLVKNAFLDRQKLIARKLREAFLVWIMEDVVDIPKSRILEVYLNIIEFGPGIYGIHEASLHYFGKRPDELTAGEVSWLFSILSSPKRYHFYWERGEITERWWANMKRRMKAMVNREKMTEAEYEASIQQIPKFYKPDKTTEPVLKPKVQDLYRIPLLFGDDTADDADDAPQKKPFRFGP